MNMKEPKWPFIDRHQYHASKAIVQLIADQMDRPPTCGIEIGVYTGVTSMMLLRYFRELHLYMIDPYLPYEHSRTSEEHLIARDQAKFRTQCYSGRRHLILEKSEDAKRMFPASYADFVFIDGDHSFEGVKSDLLNYSKRVRKGGLVICHDAKQGQVYRAVRDHCQRLQVTLYRGLAKSAWFFIPDGHDILYDSGLKRSAIKKRKPNPPIVDGENCP
jgi:predicted O-methyltransferase YrrM